MIRKIPTLSVVILAGFTFGTVSIVAAEEPAAPTDTTERPDTLEEIQVVGRFLNTSNTSAMKLNVPVLDTPFSVSSYSAALLKSLESVSLQDNYNYMNGVKKAGQTAYDLTIRGFKTGGDHAAEIQLRCIDTALNLTGKHPFLAGMFWWKWFPEPPNDEKENYCLQTPAIKALIAKHWSR